MKELLDKLLRFIKYSKELDMKPYYIIDYLGKPLLIRKDELISSISRTYSTTRDNRYLDIEDELLSKELKRAKEKIQ